MYQLDFIKLNKNCAKYPPRPNGYNRALIDQISWCESSVFCFIIILI